MLMVILNYTTDNKLYFLTINILNNLIKKGVNFFELTPFLLFNNRPYSQLLQVRLQKFLCI